MCHVWSQVYIMAKSLTGHWHVSEGGCADRRSLSCEHSRVLSVCAQCPPGMKQQVLLFYTKLLGRIRQPLLPHINVHRPVQVRTPLTAG